MARKKIREYDGKRLVSRHLTKKKEIKLGGATTIQTRLAQVSAKSLKAASNPATFYKLLSDENPWLLDTELVVKTDMLFGKRGKNNLVLLKADYKSAQDFIAERMGNEIEVSNVTGTLTTFLIEPFVPHEHEFYLSIQTVREGDQLSFGACGGVEIEENWDKVHSVIVPSGEPENDIPLDIENHVNPLLVDPNIRDEDRSTLASFIAACFETYEFDMTLLEMNPFALDTQGLPAILDARVELDSYASFKNIKLWGSDLEFPEPWGREKCEEERIVQAMDDKSGASMKLTVLNPGGKMWTMVAGGGASVIYADQVVQLGFGDELGNYAEYSGNPKEQETYMYGRNLLNLVTRNPDGGRRALLCGGGVANFSDIAATLGGVQQAITDFHGKLQMAKVKVFVRRGGPNYKAGPQLMRDLGSKLDIPIEVYGPETNMTHILSLGLRWIEQGV